MVDNPPPPLRRTSRVGLAVGAGVILGFALLLFVVIDAANRGGHVSPSRSGISHLKSLSSAQADFKSNDRDGNGSADYWVGDVYSLFAMCPEGSDVKRENMIKLIEPSVAAADATRPSHARAVAIAQSIGGWSSKSGYLFAVIPRDERGRPYDEGGGRNAGRFAVCTYPEKYDSGGSWFGGRRPALRTAIVDETATIWVKDTRGAPVVQWPADPEGEGWRKID